MGEFLYLANLFKTLVCVFVIFEPIVCLLSNWHKANNYTNFNLHQEINSIPWMYLFLWYCLVLHIDVFLCCFQFTYTLIFQYNLKINCSLVICPHTPQWEITEFFQGKERCSSSLSLISVLYPWSKLRNTENICTITVTIYQQSADNPMLWVWS